METLHQVATDTEERLRLPELGRTRVSLSTEVSQSLAIMGARGSGKTTVLAAVCDALSTARTHIVLPVLKPELFGAEDSLTSVFLAELWEQVAMGDQDSPFSDAIVKQLAQVARGAAIAETPLQALETGN